MIAMLPSFCNDTVNVIRATERDNRGSIVLDWSNPTVTQIGRCSVQPGTTSRDFDGRTIQVTEDWTLYAPPGSDIRAGDRVEWNDAVFEIDGAVMEWKSPTGRISHMWARLKEWRG